MLLCCVKKWFTNEQASFTMQKLKMIFFIYYNHFLLVFWKIKPCIITGIMQGLPFPIITYQVITGNYSGTSQFPFFYPIITYQVITGNYSWAVQRITMTLYYNIPSNNRELQQMKNEWLGQFYYNIPSNNRELQPQSVRHDFIFYYNIPSNNRELQLVWICLIRS